MSQKTIVLHAAGAIEIELDQRNNPRVTVSPPAPKHSRENVSVEGSSKVSGTSIPSYEHFNLELSARLLGLLASCT